MSVWYSINSIISEFLWNWKWIGKFEETTEKINISLNHTQWSSQHFCLLEKLIWRSPWSVIEEKYHFVRIRTKLKNLKKFTIFSKKKQNEVKIHSKVISPKWNSVNFNNPNWHFQEGFLNIWFDFIWNNILINHQ